MKTFLAALGGVAIGAGAALLFAPQTGRATRAMIKDKATKYSHDMQEFVDGKARHFHNRAEGFRHMADDMMDRGKEAMGSMDGSSQPEEAMA